MEKVKLIVNEDQHVDQIIVKAVNEVVFVDHYFTAIVELYYEDVVSQQAFNLHHEMEMP